MIGHLQTTTFLIYSACTALIFVLIAVASRHFLKDGMTVSVNREYFQGALQNSLSTIGVLLPLLTGLAAYLFVTGATANLSLLLMAIVILAGTMFVLIWTNFSLIRLFSAPNTPVTLTFPNDRPFVTANGIVYVGIALSIVHAILFLLVGLEPHTPPPPVPAVSAHVGFSVRFGPGQSCPTGRVKPFDILSNATGNFTSVEVLANIIREGGVSKLRIVGSADVAPLNEGAKRPYGNNVGLALNRAYCVAGDLQAALAEHQVYIGTEVSVRAPRDRRTAANDDRSVEIGLGP